MENLERLTLAEMKKFVDDQSRGRLVGARADLSLRADRAGTKDANAPAIEQRSKGYWKKQNEEVAGGRGFAPPRGAGEPTKGDHPQQPERVESPSEFQTHSALESILDFRLISGLENARVY
jgi:hypothetical protein